MAGSGQGRPQAGSLTALQATAKPLPWRVGIGGWSFASWRGPFYPEGLRRGDELSYAAQHLSAIEINATFYRNATPENFLAWRDATPADFVFAVKANRAAAYAKPGPAQHAAIARFMASGLDKLGPKLGPILWQLPVNRRFEAAMGAAVLAALPRRLGRIKLRHAVEARHESFDDPAWLRLLRQHGIASVIVDSPKQSLRTEITADFVYCRLERNSATAPEGYESQALDRWAHDIHTWSTGKNGLPCFVFCIAGDKERAPASAMALLRRLRGPQ